MTHDESKLQYLRELAIVRLERMPPNVQLNVGEYGTFTQRQLIEQIREGTEIGKEAVNLQIELIRLIPKYSKQMAAAQP